MKKPSWFEWRMTWKTWVFGIGLDLDDQKAFGICVGPFCLWLNW